jgi:Homeodomain-like domain-containing protein
MTKIRPCYTLLTVQADPSEQEEKVRPLAQAGLSTREIAAVVDMSQSTVSRVIQRINTGPHPIVKPRSRLREKLPFPQLPRRFRIRGAALLAVALLLLAFGLASLTYLRGRPIHTYIRIVDPPAPISVCVGITLQGYMTDLANATNGKCPAGWKLLVLYPKS